MTNLVGLRLLELIYTMVNQYKKAILTIFVSFLFSILGLSVVKADSSIIINGRVKDMILPYSQVAVAPRVGQVWRRYNNTVCEIVSSGGTSYILQPYVNFPESSELSGTRYNVSISKFSTEYIFVANSYYEYVQSLVSPTPTPTPTPEPTIEPTPIVEPTPEPTPIPDIPENPEVNNYKTVVTELVVLIFGIAVTLGFLVGKTAFGWFK